MVPLTSLWVPILVSAVIVFVAASIFHMVLPFHRKDFRQLPAEGDVGDVMRRSNIPPGDYMIPFGGSPAAMKDPAFVEKMTKGPVVVMTVMPPGPPRLGPSLALYFLYCVVVSIFAAYVTGRALGPGASYLEVFRFAGTVAFIGHSVALWQSTIWYKRAWRTTALQTIDGLIYGMLTAGTFGWLWPK